MQNKKSIFDYFFPPNDPKLSEVMAQNVYLVMQEYEEMTVEQRKEQADRSERMWNKLLYGNK